jgi:hypothetical protein
MDLIGFLRHVSSLARDDGRDCSDYDDRDNSLVNGTSDYSGEICFDVSAFTPRAFPTKLTSSGPLLVVSPPTTVVQGQ